jgi:N-acetyl-gamma-glutamyl-phosphate reductase
MPSLKPWVKHAGGAKLAKTTVGIINVTGYAGAELARLLLHHPGVELTSVSARSVAGKGLIEVFPHLGSSRLSIGSSVEPADIVFCALPHKESSLEVIPLLEKGVRVIDLSADFRLSDPTLYESWYGFRHPRPDLLNQAVFGLTELYRDKVKGASLVANPGCYPTGAILALAPAVRAGLVTKRVIIDSKSGLSGAGRSLSLNTHFAEADEDTAAYALNGHRHLPEISQELGKLMGAPVEITFVPHLVPMTRGILTTAYAPLSDGVDQSQILDAYRQFYAADPFVRVVADAPHTKNTSGSNMCHVYPVIDSRTRWLIAVSAIDNLVKGAAGQAVQNMNVMLGLDETVGLETSAIWP